MNNAPGNQTGTGNTFSQGSPQSNPFTADLKGEFTSNFGTNTNAVSQIFKEGGFVSSNKSKYLLIAAGVLVVLAVVFYFYSNESSSEDSDEDVATAEKVEPPKAETKPAETKVAEAPVEPKPVEQPVAQEVPPPSKASRAAPTFSGDIVLGGPSSGASITYDETTGGAEFTWRGAPGSTIVMSRSKSMRSPVFRKTVRGSSFSFSHPWPGTWYWRVESGGSTSETRSFTVSAPPRRQIAVSQPASGGTIAGSGGVVSWQQAEKVAFYRVEFSNGGWANPQFRFASAGNSVQLQGVTAGQYQMRLGAFSEVSGRWEYTAPMPVTVQ